MRDRRYVYMPIQGQLSLGLRGDDRGPRRAVHEVLDDILALFGAAERPQSEVGNT